MGRAGLVFGVIALAKEVGRDLRRDADGKIPLTSAEALAILVDLGIVVADVVVG